MVGEMPSYTFDPVNTRLGRRAVDLFLRAHLMKPPYPPRTMIEVQRLFDDDIVEIDSVFYAPSKK